MHNLFKLMKRSFDSLRSLRMNEQGLIHLIPLLLLLAGIIAGVYLVIEGPKIFKPRATGENIEFLGSSCSTLKDGKKALSCPTVKFKLISPLETGNAAKETESSFNLVKTVYAAGSGEGYYCKEDKSWIYHKKCDLVFNFLCSLPWWEDELKEKEESCGELRCVPTSADLFKQSAACAVVEESSARTTFQPVVSNQIVTPKPQEPTLQPRRAADLLPTTPARVTPTPRAVSSPTPTPTSSHSPTPTPTPQPSPSLTPTPTAQQEGIGQTNPQKKEERKTLKYRFAENPTDLQKAEWRLYEVGGVEIVYDFSDPKPGIKSIYAQFLDNQEPGQIIKFSDGLDYVVRNIELISPVKPSPTAGPTSIPKPTAAPTSTPRPTATSTPPPVSTCNVQNDIASWPNCSNEELMSLPASLRDRLPNEAIINFSNEDLLRLFPKTRLATLPSSTLQSFSNSDLLAIADASGYDRRTFFSNFSCNRIVLFSQEVQNQIGLCQ